MSRDDQLISPLEGEMGGSPEGGARRVSSGANAEPPRPPSALPGISPSRGEIGQSPAPRSCRPVLSRRAVLAGLATTLLPRRAHAQPPRIAAIDWGMLETALALGITPVAATELIQFRRLAVEPNVPPETADLGLRGTPNFELLRLVAPDLILISNFYEYQRPALERIAPVFSAPLYLPGQPPYAQAQQATLALGETLGSAEAGRRLVREAAAELQALRTKLAPLSARPVFAISIGDAQHFRAFGADSMFGDVMTRLGLRNAWSQETQYGAAAPVGIAALAAVPDAAIVIVPPVPPDAARALPESALWNALPAVARGRVVTLASVNHFGALPAARRFARLLAAGLAGG